MAEGSATLRADLERASPGIKLEVWPERVSRILEKYSITREGVV
jgi:hypothetical protein